MRSLIAKFFSLDNVYFIIVALEPEALNKESNGEILQLRGNF